MSFFDHWQPCAVENIARIGATASCKGGSLFSGYPGLKFRKSLLNTLDKMGAKMTLHGPSHILKLREPLPDLNRGLATGNYLYG
jgi:hypothetical protein